MLVHSLQRFKKLCQSHHINIYFITFPFDTIIHTYIKKLWLGKCDNDQFFMFKSFKYSINTKYKVKRSHTKYVFSIFILYFDEDIGYSPSGNLIGGLLPTNIIQTMGKKKTKKKKSLNI